jgi:hypothetical protein
MKNLTAFLPDLLLLWGDEERLDFERSQLAINPDLEKTAVKIVGVPIYDHYRLAKPSGMVRAKYGIADDERIILYTAFPEESVPYQYSLCKALIQILRKSDVPAKIIVRLRPGTDPTRWTEFASMHQDVVILQTPEGAVFDKVGSRSEFVLATEQNEVALYMDTLASACLLVSPAFSTTILDAFATGTSAVVAPIDPEGPEMPVGASARLARWLSSQKVRFPAWRSMPVAQNREELEVEVLAALSADGSQSSVPTTFQKFIHNGNDGQAGNRWITAVSEFLEADTGNWNQGTD